MMSRIRLWVLGVLLLVVAGVTAQLRSRSDSSLRQERGSLSKPAGRDATGDSSSHAGSRFQSSDENRARSNDDASDLTELEMRFRRRVEKLAQEIQSRLVDLDPSAGVGYLQQVLSLNADWSADQMPDDRIRRVLAASFLPWIVDRDQTLGGSVLQLAMSFAQNEQDPEVRWQLLGSMVGAGLKPTVLRITEREDLASKTVEGFAAEFGHQSLGRWKRALLEVVEKDERALDYLERVARRVYQEPARQVVLDGLALMENDRTRTFIVGLFREDSTSRARLVAALSRRDDMEVLDAFVSALERERDQYLVSVILRRIATSNHARDGWGLVLKEQYARLGTERSQSVGQSNVVPACARVFASSHDMDALSVVEDALGSDDSRVFRSAISAIQKNPDTGYVPELTRQLGRASHPYLREEISYALRKIDPHGPYESLMWDIDALTSRSKEKLSPEEKRHLEEQLSEKRAKLDAMRKQP